MSATALLAWPAALPLLPLPCPPRGHDLRGARALASARVAGVLERNAGCVPCWRGVALAQKSTRSQRQAWHRALLARELVRGSSATTPVSAWRVR